MLKKFIDGVKDTTRGEMAANTASLIFEGLFTLLGMAAWNGVLYLLGVEDERELGKKIDGYLEVKEK